MSDYRVTFEDVGFTDDKRWTTCELSPASVAAFNRAARQRQMFADPIVRLMGARVAEDEEQGSKDIKVFVSIDLMVKAVSEDAAEKFPPPVALLERIASLLIRRASKGVDMQGNWECLMACTPGVDAIRRLTNSCPST